jgi:hypothetical protein
VRGVLFWGNGRLKLMCSLNIWEELLFWAKITVGLIVLIWVWALDLGCMGWIVEDGFALLVHVGSDGLVGFGWVLGLDVWDRYSRRYGWNVMYKVNFAQ